ncbi:hypothetical protein C8F04DRAFT_1261533 [Mycena alexandri]|uniref:Uncharacterized protein n=1 Tax=Mycena alexandri TaxID=1745969 RepID=A0AAD6X5L1_9AGAR|nr:hypothetical protein C8F04DRAFT_1261533 [Mycena alexandri]
MVYFRVARSGMWWRSLQPSGREVVEETGMMTMPMEMEWGKLTKMSGRNGFLQVMASLFWWGLEEFRDGREDKSGWAAAVGDVEGILYGVLRSGEVQASTWKKGAAGKKRKATDMEVEEGGRHSKRIAGEKSGETSGRETRGAAGKTAVRPKPRPVRKAKAVCIAILKPRRSHFSFTEPQTIRAVAGCRNAFMEALYHAEVLLWNHSTMQLEVRERFHHIKANCSPIISSFRPPFADTQPSFPKTYLHHPFLVDYDAARAQVVWHALLRIGRDELAGLLHQLLVLRFRDDYALTRLFNAGFLEEQYPEATHRSWDLLNDLTKPLPRTSRANHNDTASTSHVPNIADVEIDSAMPDLDSSEYELGYPASNYEHRHEKENDEDMDDVADDSSNMDVGSSVGSDFYSYCGSPDVLTRHSV